MDSLFTSVLEISWQAGLIALAVMAVRPLLRRAPRRAVCMLWLLVALRLLLPARLTVESPVSLQQPESPPIQAYQELRQQEKVYVSAPPEQRLEMAGPAAAQGFALLDQLPAIWLTGVGCMALYMALSLLRTPHLCAGNRVGAGLSPGAGPRKVPYPPLGPCVETVGISAAGGQLVQPGPLGGVCPAGPRHGARL